MEAFGLLPASLEGNKYLIITTDDFIWYSESYPDFEVQSAVVSKVLEKFISAHGIPENLLTDRGTNFIS